MDDKDKEIQQLKEEIKKLTRAYTVLEHRVKRLTGRVIRIDESSRRALQRALPPYKK